MSWAPRCLRAGGPLRSSLGSFRGLGLWRTGLRVLGWSAWQRARGVRGSLPLPPEQPQPRALPLWQMGCAQPGHSPHSFGMGGCRLAITSATSGPPPTPRPSVPNRTLGLPSSLRGPEGFLWAWALHSPLDIPMPPFNAGGEPCPCAFSVGGFGETTCHLSLTVLL